MRHATESPNVVTVKEQPIVQWSYLGCCIQCGGPMSARGMAEVGARFDYYLTCQECRTLHTLQVKVG